MYYFQHLKERLFSKRKHSEWKHWLVTIPNSQMTKLCLDPRSASFVPASRALAGNSDCLTMPNRLFLLVLSRECWVLWNGRRRNQPPTWGQVGKEHVLFFLRIRGSVRVRTRDELGRDTKTNFVGIICTFEANSLNRRHQLFRCKFYFRFRFEGFISKRTTCHTQ